MIHTIQPKNPLHWITLKAILTYLVEIYWREKLWQKIDIKCFQINPTINSSLTFLRKQDWARWEVEHLYLWTKEHE